MMRTILLTATAVTLAMACSRSSVNVQCAKVSAVLAEPEPYNLPTLHSENYNPRALSGFIIVTERKKDPDSGQQLEVTFKCAAQISKALDTEQLILWTANHCLDFRTLKSLRFIRYDASELTDGVGIFAEDEAIDDAMSELRAARSILGSKLSDSAVDEVMAKLMPPLERRGESACKAEYDRWSAVNDSADEKHFQRLCTSLDDLIVFAFPIPSEDKRSPALASMVSRLDKMSSAAPLPANLRQDTIKWENAHKLYINDLFRVGSATVAEGVASCASPSPTLSPETCANKEVLLSAIGVVSKGFNLDTTVAQAKASADNRLAAIRSLWATHLGALADKQDKLFWNGNFLFGNEGPIRFDFGPLKISGKTASLHLPVRVGQLPESFSEVKAEIFGNSGEGVGSTLTLPKNIVRIEFGPGDSGSLLMFRMGDGAYLPVGVLSTVNGRSVSGGLAMRPVGKGEEDEGTKSNGDGTVVKQPPPPQQPQGRPCQKG